MAETKNAQAQSSTKGLDAGKKAEAKVPAGQTQGSNDLIYADRVTPEFCQKVKKISSNIGVDPNHLMACMCFETGGEFKAKWYKSSNAVGLIQFTQAAVDELNVNPQLAPKAKTSKNALSQMTEIEQLDYVEKYFLIHKTKYKRSMSNVADLYMAIFCPAGVGKKDDYVLYKKGTKAYSSNNGLDKNKDGLITKAEAASKPMQKLQEGFQEQEDRNAPDIGSGTIKLQKDPTLSMRSGAGRGFQVIGKIPNGASFTYIKENNGWLRIRYNGKMGWISKQYTLLDSATNAAMPTSTSLAVADNTATPVAKPSTTKPQDTAAPTAATTVVEQSQESASPVPKPAKEAPVAPEAAPKVADVLSTTKAAEAVKWYTDNKFTADLIQRIQTAVGIKDPSTTMTPSAVQAVAAWQKLKGCTYVDGEFGNGSAAKTNDAQLKADIAKLLPEKASSAKKKASSAKKTSTDKYAGPVGEFKKTDVGFESQGAKANSKHRILPYVSQTHYKEMQQRMGSTPYEDWNINTPRRTKKVKGKTVFADNGKGAIGDIYAEAKKLNSTGPKDKGTSTIASSACGAVAFGNLHNKKPIEAVKYANEQNGRWYGRGTQPEFFRKQSGFVQELSKAGPDYADVGLKAVSEGQYFIASVGPSVWTGNGHFILVHGYDNRNGKDIIYTSDSGRGVRQGTISQFRSTFTRGYIFKK